MPLPLLLLPLRSVTTATTTAGAKRLLAPLQTMDGVKPELPMAVMVRTIMKDGSMLLYLRLLDLQRRRLPTSNFKTTLKV